MINGLRVLGLITARGGSKGLPQKNIRPLLGKPLIGWTIEQALACPQLDRLVVSTDSPAIAEAARQFGADVPFMRPAELASDTASSIDVVLHALDELAAAQAHYDLVALLEPTAPLRESADIAAALHQLLAHPLARSIVGVARAETVHPAFIVKRENDLLRPYGGAAFGQMRRQDLDEAFYFSGTLYISYTDTLRSARGFYHDRTLPYIVPKEKAFEIDDLTDFRIVEALLAARVQSSTAAT